MGDMRRIDHEAMSHGGVTSGKKPGIKDRLPLTDESSGSMPFKKWLALFFIEKGRYKITERAYAELAPEACRQGTHFLEDNSARERSTKVEIARPLTKMELTATVVKRVEEILREGRAEELYLGGHMVHKS